MLSDEMLLDKSKTIVLCYYVGGKSEQKVCFHHLNFAVFKTYRMSELKRGPFWTTLTSLYIEETIQYFLWM